DPGGSMDELAIRLYREAIRRLEERGVGPEGTITVRDLFEEVVPYASVREPLGFELKADYDHALLQLLASPDSPLGLEPGEARDAVRRELEGATPDPHVVRDHPDARVRFVPAVVGPEAPAPA